MSMFELLPRFPFASRAVLLLSLLGLAACQPGGAKSKTEQEAPPIPVDAALIDTAPLVAAYRGTATLSAEGAATVVARTAGVIEAIAVEEGDRVETGAVLARLDTERLQLEADRAKAQLDKLVADVTRAERVHTRGLISNEKYEQLRFERDAAKAAYDLAALSVREAVIRAPFAGVISRRHIKTGNLITSGTAAFDLVKLEPLEAELYVPERDLGKLQPGHAATLRVDAYGERAFAGRVARVSPVVDAATGTVKVTVEMTPGQAELKPGMFGRVEIAYDRRENALRVPAAAVITEDAQATVFVVEDGHARKRAISLGYQDGGYYEVLDGLSTGNAVVTTGQSNLRDNAKVTVVGGSAAAALAPSPTPAAAAEEQG
jgi:membrane fusion protein, multidrug efflux system